MLLSERALAAEMQSLGHAFQHLASAGTSMAGAMANLKEALLRSADPKDRAVLDARAVTMEIAKRAGAESGKCPVFMAPEEDALRAPTLQRVHGRNLRARSVGKGPKHGRLYQRVIVGREWLCRFAPEYWAVIVTVRLHGVPISDVLPSLIKE